MRTNAQGRAVIELSDIDLAHGVYSYRWFWVAFVLLFIVWVVQ